MGAWGAVVADFEAFGLAGAAGFEGPTGFIVVDFEAVGLIVDDFERGCVLEGFEVNDVGRTMELRGGGPVPEGAAVCVWASVVDVLGFAGGFDGTEGRLVEDVECC